nr:SRP72 RNA-binding domain-containing protein [Tanacetum cinerariifolium]
MSDMIALLNDLSYIPSNNEQNEPTQGDISETSNKSTQAKRNEFKELYTSGNEELYLDCDYVTQNSGICSPGGKDGEMYYGQLQEIFEFSFKVLLFRVKWFDTSNEGQEDPDVINFDNSSDLPLSTSLNDLDNATLHIDVQSMEVDAPPDIIDLDADDNIIDDEDTLPHDLTYFNDEDLVNVDDDDGVDMLHGAVTVTATVMIVPLHTIYPSVARVDSLTEQRHPKTQFGWKENGQAAYPPGDPKPQEEMLRLQALGFNTSLGVPYTEEEINALARKGKQQGYLPSVGRVLPGRATDVLGPPCLNMLNQYESSPEFGNASGSGGCGDDEMADDEDGGEDEEDEEDDDS